MTRLVMIATTTTLALAAASCNRATPAATQAAATQAAATRATRTEVVLSADAQREGQIETQPVRSSDVPATAQVPGTIALADNRSWRVGIRTDGLVVAVMAGAGDYVQKGQMLARYHADEVRDSRAKYHAAQAEVARARRVRRSRSGTWIERTSCSS